MSLRRSERQRPPARARWRRTAGVGAVLALVLAAGVWTALAPIKARLEETTLDMQHIRSGNLSGSFGPRVMMARVALEMIAAQPLLANGLAAFHQRIEAWADQQGLAPKAIERGFQNPHDQFLCRAQSFGLPAAALCVVMLQGARAHRPAQLGRSPHNLVRAVGDGADLPAQRG